MKWIKHQTATRRDEKIARLIAKHGLGAYGLYWAVQEILADHMEGPSPSCRVSYPLSMWAQQLSIYAPQVKKQLQWLADAALIELTWSENEICIENTKLLKYRDEYSRKSGQSASNIRSNSQLETDTEKEADTDTESEEESTIAPSAKKKRSVPVDDPPPAGVFEFPLNDKSNYQVPEELYREFVRAYPGVSVMSEFAEMRVWLIANPTRKKTRKGMPAFMNSWLGRSQNHAKGKVNGNGRHTGESVLDRIQRGRTEGRANTERSGTAEGDTREAPESESGALVGAKPDGFQW